MSLSAAVAAPARPASAQPAANANARFSQGQKLFDEKKFADALPIFKELADESSSPNAWLYVGRCLRELGRIAEAHEAMATTVRIATARAEREAKYAETRNAAAAELAILDAKVAKVVVAPPAGGGDLRVRVGSRTLTPAQIGVPFAIEPGSVTVVAETADGRSSSQTVQLAAGETKAVALAAPTAAADESKPAGLAAGGDADTKPAPSSTLRTVGFVVAGVGVGGLVLAAVASASATSKYDTVSSECGGKRCTDPKYADTIDSGKTLDTVANVGLFAGIGLVSAGAALVAVGWPRGEPAKTGATGGARVSVQLSPRSVRLSGRF